MKRRGHAKGIAPAEIRIKVGHRSELMRVLVIEDDRKVASFIQTGLQQEGYAVDVLHDGHTAGEQAAAVDYDAVVLDLMLPGRYA
jgi:CheY-like chemotaxis protein